MPSSKPSVEQVDTAGVQTISDGGYSFDIDALGRTRIAEGQLRLEPGRKRSRSAQRRASNPASGLPDDGGHLIGHQFGGPAAPHNLIPQNWRVNRVQYREHERRLAAALRNGASVRVRISPVYDSVDPRPVAIRYEAWIDGDWSLQEFPNPREVKAMSDHQRFGDMLREIGELAVDLVDEVRGKILIVTTQMTGMFSVDIYHDVGNRVDRLMSDDELNKAIRDYWFAEEPEKRWTLMTYVIDGDRFKAAFKFEDELTRDEIFISASKKPVKETFGDKPINDPMSFPPGGGPGGPE